MNLAKFLRNEQKNGSKSLRFKIHVLYLVLQEVGTMQVFFERQFKRKQESLDIITSTCPKTKTRTSLCPLFSNTQYKSNIKHVRKQIIQRRFLLSVQRLGKKFQNAR